MSFTAELESLGINVIRGLAMDAPAKANSGHQGTAMALAPLAHVLYTRVMRYDASAPQWADRDRFVLSAGHASILQYSLLYLTGFGLTLDDLKDFRQWDSATPGHPEVHHTAGVEVTTGPLGQGIANAVGMAIAERSTRATFGEAVSNHHIWCIAGDGDLSEGVSHEAASFAGHLKLDNLTVIYDDNHISIDGPTELSLTDDAPARFRAYGWNVIEIGEAAEDLDAIEQALLTAKAHRGAPTLIVLRSHIGYPSPTLTDSASAHGLAFKPADIAAAKEVMGLPAQESFHVPDEVLAAYRAAGTRGAEARAAWEAGLDAALGELKERYVARENLTGVDGWIESIPSWSAGESVATRVALAKVLTALVDVVPGIAGGGADLTGNTGTELKGEAPLSADNPAGRQIHFGVREHAMGSTMNGMALHGGILPVGGTFLVFSDYMRPAVRLAALMGTKVLFAWSHDSVGVGEDGPTHQPIEHIASLRAIPGLDVLRPADANETAHAVRLTIEGDGPVALIMSRQNLPVLEGTSYEGVAKGAYALSDPADAQVTLVATGSEVSLIVDAAARLAESGIAARVVSMPSWERFEAAGRAYQDEVLRRDLPTLAVEAGVTFGWHRWADDVVGIDRFGASAPGDVVLDKLGLNVDHVVARATALIG